jgi:hypothetical protein
MLVMILPLHLLIDRLVSLLEAGNMDARGDGLELT